MSSAWGSPHRSEPMPEIIVKIVGSKHFRYFVEKPKSKQNEKSKTEPQTTLQKPRADYTRQVSRDLPDPTDPSDEKATAHPANKGASKHPSRGHKPEGNQSFLSGAHSNRFLDGRYSHEAKAYCSSVPTGDQSLSYIHCLPRRKSRDGSWEHAAEDSSDHSKEIFQRPCKTTREDSFLLTLVRKELKSRPLSSSLLGKLLKELKALDPGVSGCLLHSQLSRLFLRHEVPLQLPTVQLLCQRFSRRGFPEMVNYGELLWFLKEATSDNLQQNGETLYSQPRRTPSHSHHRQSTPLQGSSSLSEVNKSLLEILKMALRPYQGKFNIDSISLSLHKEDHSFSGLLPLHKPNVWMIRAASDREYSSKIKEGGAYFGSQMEVTDLRGKEITATGACSSWLHCIKGQEVRAICGKHGLYLTMTLLETLLNHQDLGYKGEIKWQNLVKWIERAASDSSYDLPAGKNEKETSQDLVEVPERPQSKTKYVKIPEESLRPENPTAMTSAPEEPVKSFKNRPVSEPVVDSAMMKEAKEPELWIDRFRKLEKALYLSDLSNKGILEIERTRRLIHNYNLIYNLSLSPHRINQALQRFRSGENIILEPALQYLKEL